MNDGAVITDCPALVGIYEIYTIKIVFEMDGVGVTGFGKSEERNKKDSEAKNNQGEKFISFFHVSTSFSRKCFNNEQTIFPYQKVCAGFSLKD